MVKYLYIALLFLSASCSAQAPVCAGGAPVTPTPEPTQGKKYLLIFNGESNSGGAALNDSATVGELAVRNKVFILNNNLAGQPLAFQPLDIGTNNLVGHTGYSNPGENNPNQHGWELGFANLVESDSYFDTMWIVKTGQGSSYLEQWTYDTICPLGFACPYYGQFTKRVDSAIQLMGSRDYEIILLLSIGINDISRGTTAENYKIRLNIHLTNIRRHIGASQPIIMTKFMTGKTNYNSTIDDVCNENANTYSIIGTDAALNSDQIHWSYSGLKTLVSRFTTVIKSIYP